MKKDCYTKLHLAPKVDSPKLPIQRKRSNLRLQRNLSCLSRTPAPTEWMRNYDFEQRQSQVFKSSESAQDALLKLGKFLGEIFQADCCFIAASSSLNTCWLPGGLSTHLQQKLWGWFQQPVLQQQWINDELTIADVQTLLPQDDFPFQSILAICTRHYGKFNGMICLMRTASQIPHGLPTPAWKEQDLQLLKTLSPQVAIAITQARLEHQAQQQVCYQTVNDQLTAAIRTNVDLTQIFDLALAGISQSTRASRGMVLLIKDAEPLAETHAAEVVLNPKITLASEYPQACPFPKLTTREAANLKVLEQNQDSWLNYSFPAAECSLCQTLLTETLEPLVVSALINPDEPIQVAPIFELENLPSLLLMPIEHQGKVMGWLVLQHCELREWAVEERSFVKLVAAQLSTAIVQTRSLQHIQAIVTERTTQLQRSLEVQAKLYEKTRQQLEQLRKLDEEREEFLSTVSHELLTPLTSMSLAVRMLQQATLTPDRQARYLDILEQQCQQETQLINDMLALRKLEANSTAAQLHRIELQPLIRDLGQSDQERWQKKGLELCLDLPPHPLTIHSELESFNRILVELLDNARKYADFNSQVHLKVQTNPLNRSIVLTLRSIGLGIQPQEIEQVFNKFKRGEGATKQAIQGTGLGLALVKGLVEHLNGAIAVSSKPAPSGQSWETCFTLTLPANPNGLNHTH